jgi:hypothetical protein
LTRFAIGVKSYNGEMFIERLNDWRKLLLLKEERFSLSLSEIFALSPKDLKELQVAEILGAPSFMRVDGKRWCQASFWKGGRSFRPPSPSPERAEKR